MTEPMTITRQQKWSILVLAALVFIVASGIGAAYVHSLNQETAQMFYPPTTVSYVELIARLSAKTYHLVPYGVLFGLVTTICFFIFRAAMGSASALAASAVIMTSPSHLTMLVPSIERDFIKAPFFLIVILLLLTVLRERTAERNWLPAEIGRRPLVWAAIAGAILAPALVPIVVGVMPGTAALKDYMIRDMVRIPMAVGSLFLIAYLAFNHSAGRRIQVIALVCGAVIGIGFTFRQDSIILLIPAAVVLALFARIDAVHSLRVRAISLCLLIGVFAPYVVLSSKDSTDYMGHRLLGGFMTPLTTDLGVKPTVYDWGDALNDRLLESLGWTYAKLAGWDPSGIDGRIQEDPAMRRGELGYALAIVRNFPADIITRSLASVRQIANLPFQYTLPPPGIINPVISAAYKIRNTILSAFDGIGPVLIGISLLIIAGVDLRVAIGSAFLIFFFAGYPAAQFQERHYFHLEFIGLFAAGFILHAAVLALRARFAVRTQYGFSFRQALAFGVGVVAVIGGGLTAARAYQSSHIASLFIAIIGADHERLSWQVVPGRDGTSHISGPDLERSGSVAEQAVLIASFAGKACGVNSVGVVVRYEGVSEEFTFSRFFMVDTRAGDGVGRLIVPVVWNQDSRLVGLDLMDEQVACLTGLGRIRHPETFPLVVFASLPSGWHSSDLYARLGNDNGNALEATGGGQGLHPLPCSEIAFSAEIARCINGVIDVNGRAPQRAELRPGDIQAEAARKLPDLKIAYSMGGGVIGQQTRTDLIRTRPMARSKGEVFIADGRIYRGGVRIVLVRREMAVGFVDLTAPGPFRVALEVPADGDYWLGIANNLGFFGRVDNMLRITRMGWAKAGS